jgi:hypothetical protein
MPLPGRDVCIMHAPDLAEKVAAARARGGTMAAKVRLLEGRRLRLDSPAALVKFTGNLLQDALAGTVDPDTARTVLYGVSVQLKAVELTQRSDVDQALQEVKALVAEARRRRA